MAQVTLSQLLQPVTADEAKALNLETLQGIGPVQQLGTGAGTIVATGQPTASYDILIQMTTAGAPGTARFTYSFDGGKTVNGPFLVPSIGTYVISGTGVTLQFAGSFDLNTQYLFSTIFPQFPVTDWESGGGARTLVEADSAITADLAGTAIPNIAAGGLNDYASGDWLTLLADQEFDNQRFEPQPTIGLVNLTLAAGASPLTLNPGDLVVTNSVGTGNGTFRFLNRDSLSLAANTTTPAVFEAQQPGARYNLSNDTLKVLATAKPGLTCNNPAPGTSSVTHSGGGTGTIAVSGNPNGNYSVVMKVLTTGGLGAGLVQFSIDGGNNYASPLTIPASGVYSIPVLDGSILTGVVVTFTGTFTATDTYSFTSFDDWITQPGTDEESDQSLQGRNSNKWSGLGLGGGTEATFDYLCRAAPNGGSEVTQTAFNPDIANPSQIRGVVSGLNGPVSTSALSNIQSFVAMFTGLCAKSAVDNSTQTTVPVVAQVFCRRVDQPRVQAAISAALQQLTQNTKIGGELTSASVFDALYQDDSGVTDVFMTNPPPNTDIFLPAGSVPLFDESGITYVLS